MEFLAMSRDGLRVLDLFCGGGGFSEGFHMAGFDVVMGIDFWGPACATHELNGLGESRKLDLLSIELDDVIALKRELESRYGPIDVVIGSPPCTEFSYAKKGGSGDIQGGMVLVKKHLLFVAVFQPRFWLMENVPRLESALDEECQRLKGGGWRISYNHIGIPVDRRKELGIKGNYLKIPCGDVFISNEYGTSERRRRFIAGRYPIGRMKQHSVSKDVSLGGLLSRLHSHDPSSDMSVEDPNYEGNMVSIENLRDIDYDTTIHPMYFEEMRHLKRRHIQYGKMNLPEDMDEPARTIMATYNSSSRESLVLQTDLTMNYHGRERPLFRQPTVREVACIQGFPLNFQLDADRINDRYKLIGNAVPCQLSFALSKSILDGYRIKRNSLSDEEQSRFEVSRSRLDGNDLNPILSRPNRIVDEAKDISSTRSFSARPNKRIRRKILSSKVFNDSSAVILENEIQMDGKVQGGVEWHAVIQRGSGKSYRRVLLDTESIKSMIRSVRGSLIWDEFSEIANALLKDVSKGIPVPSEDWDEFQGFESKATHRNDNRLPLPDIDTFQRTFTEDFPEIGDIIGPLDLFDGLDIIMSSHLSSSLIKDATVRLRGVSSSKHTLLRHDERIVDDMDGELVPVVTILACILVIRVLRTMYDSKGGRVGPFSEGIRSADDIISETFGFP